MKQLKRPQVCQLETRFHAFPGHALWFVSQQITSRTFSTSVGKAEEVTRSPEKEDISDNHHFNCNCLFSMRSFSMRSFSGSKKGVISVCPLPKREVVFQVPCSAPGGCHWFVMWKIRLRYSSGYQSSTTTSDVFLWRWFGGILCVQKSLACSVFRWVSYHNLQIQL